MPRVELLGVDVPATRGRAYTTPNARPWAKHNEGADSAVRLRTRPVVAAALPTVSTESRTPLLTSRARGFSAALGSLRSEAWDGQGVSWTSAIDAQVWRSTNSRATPALPSWRRERIVAIGWDEYLPVG